MADFELPSKVSSSKCGSFASTRASFDDASPMSVSCASDASTASPRCDDEPLKVALPSYNPMDLNDRFVFDIDAPLDSSDDDKKALEQQLQEKNLRLEQENAFLRMHYSSCLQMATQQMATQGMLGGYGLASPPGLAPGGMPMPQFASPGWLQAQWNLNAQSPCLPHMCGLVPQADTDADADAEFDEECSSDSETSKAVPRTSVMLRNLPNSYTRQLLCNLLDVEGFAGKYDFVYLPIDFKTRLSLAYAFINFINAEEATHFWQHFHGFSNWAVPSHKVARVNWSDSQGLATHIERYRSSPVMHEAVPDDFKPALFQGGQRVPFPAANAKVRAPRCRVRSKAMQPGRLA